MALRAHIFAEHNPAQTLENWCGNSETVALHNQMAELFSGVGDCYAKTLSAPTGIGQNVIVPLELFDFSFTTDSTPLEAKAQKKGIKKTVASAIGEVTSTLTLSTQLIRWSPLGFFFNQFSVSVGSVSIPVLKGGTVPSSAPYEVSDADITTSNDEGVYVYLYDGDESTYLKTVAIAPANATEVQVDGTNGKLIFHSSAAGKKFAYTLPVTETNVKRIGGARGDQYGTIEFWGTVYGPEYRIHFPSLDFKSTPSIELTGDVATLSVEFSANVVDGDDEPFRLYGAA